MAFRSPSDSSCDAGISTVSDARANGRSLWMTTRTPSPCVAGRAAAASSRRRASTRTLEQEPRAQLDVARIVAVLVHDAEGRVARILIGVPEHGVVERIDGVDAHLHGHAPRQREGLGQSDVEEVQVRGANVRQRRGEVAHVVAEDDVRIGASRTARNVEAGGVPGCAIQSYFPAARALAADARVEIARIAIGVVVEARVPRQRESALILIARAERPAAEKGVGESVPARAPALLVTERKLDHGAEGGAIGPVVRRHAALELTVRRVEIVQ